MDQFKVDTGLCISINDIDSLTNKYLSTSSVISGVIKNIKNLSTEDKKQYVSIILDTRRGMEDQIKLLRNTIVNKVNMDISLTSMGEMGYLHPITLQINFLKSCFYGNGYEEFIINDIQSIDRNFTYLNIEDNHPCKEDHQSFFIDDNNLLCTQTSAVQSYIIEQKKQQAFKVFCINKVYRRDHSVRHSPMFHQVEIMSVDQNSNYSSMLKFIKNFLNVYFNREMEIRVRNSYFPFTYLSKEIDIKLNNKWLEVAGCGMIHPKIYQRFNIEPQTGFAMGFGIERLYMLKYNLTDIRYLYDVNKTNIYKLGQRYYL